MEILFVTPYITSSCHPAFLRNQTGFGYMVHDIAQYIAKTDDVDLFAPMVFTPDMDVDGFHVVGRSKWKLLKNLKFNNLIDGLRFDFKYPQSLQDSLRTLYIFASIGQVERMLNQYDIVHIHGCSAITDAVIKACQRKNVPFVITLHGLNSFEKAIKLHESLGRYERDFLKEAVVNYYPVSFISTGNKIAVEALIGIKAGSFSVICNGCNVQIKPLTKDIRKEYGIPPGDFVFAFVGNVSVNKNQIQVARAWCLLPDDLRSKCKVLFVGRYKDDDELVQYIRDNHLENNLILCGMQPKDRVPAFYQACDATILTSITEGFGLSIIEGFVYGKPNITFADLPATEDLFDEKAMIVVRDRVDTSLANAMAHVITTPFDDTYIANYAQRFSFDHMKEKYRKLYNTIIQKL
ncbi:glycosyltransferase family 4 protein [Butyricimonas paravirosa]